MNGQSSSERKDPQEPLMATYHVNRMFPVAARGTALIFLLLLCLVYYITPVEAWVYLPDDERTVAAIASGIAGMSALMTASSFLFWGKEAGKIGGILYAGIVVMLISMITNGILAFVPTVVKEDPVLGTRVFLVRWCEWIPCAGLMTFLCDAMDVPRSKEGMRKAVLYSLCQTLSCISGLLFPYCEGIVSWSVCLAFAIVTYLPIFPRLHFKYQQYRNTSKGTSFAQMERYTRHRYAFELMLLCCIIWTVLVIAWSVNAYVHVVFPPGHPFRPRSLAVYIDATFDALAKSLYMRQIVDTHKAIFQTEGIAQRQLMELRSLMSALWGSSSDMIMLSIRYELNCLTLFSPGFQGIWKNRPADAKKEKTESDKALVLELRRDGNYDSPFEDQTSRLSDLGKIFQAYHIDSHDLSFDMFHDASIVDRVELTDDEVTVAQALVAEAWKCLTSKGSTSALVPHDIVRGDGSKCNCEMKVLPHSHNGMVAIVRDVSERFRRFEAERRAEAETLRRQKESQSVRSDI